MGDAYSMELIAELLRLRLAKLQRCQSEQCEDQRANPEAGNHFGFGPAHQLEVMVQGCHLEDALLPQLVAAYLQDDRERLEHEDAADERQQQLLLDDDGDG